ncbi:Uncharacterised protein [Mycobacterium tuberculosis]|nr:Uncharacterised protein [Mycobacterium tuberculosis]
MRQQKTTTGQTVFDQRCQNENHQQFYQHQSQRQQQTACGQNGCTAEREENREKQDCHNHLFQTDPPFHQRQTGTGVLGQRPFLQFLLGFRDVERDFAHFDKGRETTGQHGQESGGR